MKVNFALAAFNANQQPRFHVNKTFPLNKSLDKDTNNTFCALKIFPNLKICCLLV